jgi:hypothetical protein
MTTILIPILLCPLVLWAYFRVSLPNTTFEFDFDTAHATFSLMIDRFIGIARTIMAVGFGMALASKYTHASSDVVICCLAGAIYGFLFNVYLVCRYETYLHLRYPRNGMPGQSNYTVSRYATTLALGWSAMFLTLVGVIAAVVR